MIVASGRFFPLPELNPEEVLPVSKQIHLTSGPITGQLIRLCLPLLAANVLQQLYNIINSLVVTYYIGDSAFAALPPEKAAEIQSAAKAVYRALDCRVFARVDLFLTPSGEIVFNEVNTIPGFTSISMYPKLFEASGIPYSELIDDLIALALEA